MSDERRRRLKRLALSSVLLSISLCAAARVVADCEEKPTRKIEGVVYFTNNSPDDYAFLVELFDSRRRRVAAKWTEGQTGRFEFTGLRFAKYYIQVVASPRCVLQYEVDAREKQPERLQVFGDADCGRSKVKGLPAPRPVPRGNKP